MPAISRRDFLRTSALAGIGLLGNRVQAARPTNTKGDRNDQLQVAIIGVHGRGLDHIAGMAGQHNCLITAICDVDQTVVEPAMKACEERQGKRPRYQQDIRKLLDDKSIDLVTIATPNHWHALAAIWAMQAGKDVYVEKPVSHNVREGRRLIEVARQTNRICQAGTQSRSNSGIRKLPNWMALPAIQRLEL